STLYRGTLSEGRVTGIGTQSINKDNRVYYVDLIQTSFNVFKGDSGSPIFDESGKLLGIVAANRVSVHGITYVIPSNTIGQYVLDLIADTKPAAQ
ncbi:MAG: S1C family serine protease, partial [Candidatus Omnitrophota bacterium]